MYNDPMKAFKYLLLATIALPLLSSCRGQLSEQEPVHPVMDMDQQRRFEPQEQNEFFADNRAMRQPVEGTIARGKLRQDKAYYQGINEDSSFVEEIPVDVTKSFIYRGKDQYEVFCTPCHGNAGDGNGIIMANNYGYVPAPSFHVERLQNQSDGYIYSTIANGIRNMPSYATQIDVKDRWAIVAYVRALQRSQNVPEEDMKKYDVDLASLQETFAEQQAAEEAKKEEQAAQAGGEVSVQRGRMVAENNACLTCHSVDGSQLTGPTWQNTYGYERELASGETIIIDEEYLQESIVNPNAKITAGYAGVMPNYSYLSDSEVNSLVEYIKSLSDKTEAE